MLMRKTTNSIVLALAVIFAFPFPGMVAAQPANQISVVSFDAETFITVQETENKSEVRIQKTECLT